MRESNGSRISRTVITKCVRRKLSHEQYIYRSSSFFSISCDIKNWKRMAEELMEWSDRNRFISLASRFSLITCHISLSHEIRILFAGKMLTPTLSLRVCEFRAREKCSKYCVKRERVPSSFYLFKQNTNYLLFDGTRRTTIQTCASHVEPQDMIFGV